MSNYSLLSVHRVQGKKMALSWLTQICSCYMHFPELESQPDVQRRFTILPELALASA